MKGNVTLPPKITKDKVRCPRCCLNFIDYPPNTQLKCKTKQNRFHKKMLKRLEEGYKLTSFQQKYKKQLSKISDKNTMVGSEIVQLNLIYIASLNGNSIFKKTSQTYSICSQHFGGVLERDMRILYVRFINFNSFFNC